MPEIGSRIKFLRVSQGLTQDELADRIGVKKAHVSNWENDKNQPSKENLDSLAIALGVSVKDLYEKNITSVQETETQGYSVKPKPNAERIDLEWIDVPIVEVKARAGYLRGYNDPEYMESLPKTMVRKDFERGGNFIAFRIEGDSMDDGTSRSVLDNDVILGREVARHHWASKLFYKKYWFIIVSDNDGIVLKEITDHDVENGIITCHSINNVYEDFKMNLSEVKQIFNFIRIVERKPKI